MSLISPTQSFARDPMDLERLAEELASREHDNITSRLSQENHDLPLYIPLSHNNPYLSAEAFNVEEFLLSRSHTTLPDLRSELRDYLATLKEELVKLINDDYEAFISLSTDLRGEGERLERLKEPLGDIREDVLESRNELQRIQDAIQLKLKKRASLREEKAYLHLLLKISESITRLESLLLIASPNDDEQTQDIGGLQSSNGIPRIEGDNNEDRIRGNQAKHLARVAAEYTQLLYHVSKAQREKCAFVDESQWRIDRIKSTLSSDLDNLFSTTLIQLTGMRDSTKEMRTSELDKTKWIADITECLRTYDMLGLWRDAEEVIRTEIVRGFVKKTIHSDALAAPHSPIVPHTPFVTRPRTPNPPMTASLPPRTPYTPFTAFASKQNPFEASFDMSSGIAAAHAHLLDDTDDPLAGLYNTILRFVDRDMKRIMEIADKAGMKSARSAKGATGKAHLLGIAIPSAVKSKGSEGGFEIMANVIWAEIGKAIMDELGSTVFAAGRPNEFRKHYETTQAFLRALEFIAPSSHAIETMRAHPVYTAFERRWQLPVYFQLRWKEIVTKVEESLATTKLERMPTKHLEPFVTPQAIAIWEAIGTCWSGQVYIPDLNHQFWKLNLQLLSRYRKWLESSLPAHSGSRIPPLPTDRNLSSAASPRAATPNVQLEVSPPDLVAADEALLSQLAIAITDIKAMESEVWRLWREELCMMLPDITQPDSEEETQSLEETLRSSLASLLSLIPPLSSQIIQILAHRGCDALFPMRSIPGQFRAMSSSKRLPTEQSHFVSLIFKAFKSFFAIGSADGPGARLKDSFMKAFAEEVFEIVAQRYIYFLTVMKKVEESLRRHKKGKKSTFSLFGSSSAAKDDDGRADEERIRTQMVLDVNAFGKEAESLGVDVSQSGTFRSLQELAHSNLTED